MQTEGLKRHSFVVRYLTLFGGEGFSKLCAFGAFAYLARTLGPGAFGVVELALSITVFFVLGVESGLGSFGAQAIARDPALAPKLIPQVGLLRCLFGIPAYVAILIVSDRFGLPGVGILAVYGVLVLLTPFFTQWVFQGLRQMQWVAGASALRYGIFALLVVLLVRRGSDPRLVAFAEVCGAIAVAVLNVVILRWVLRLRLDWHGAMPGTLSLLKSTWFLGASDLSWAAMWYSPSIITGWLADGRLYEVAWMAGAVRIVLSLHTFVWLYFFNLIPNLAKEIHEGPAGWRDLIQRSMSSSMWAACAIALAGTLFAPVIVETAYGPNYLAAVLPFQIAVWMIPVAWFSGHFRFSLIASGHQRLEFLACAAAGIVTIAAAFAGFRLVGTPGAAAALVLGGVTNTILAGIATFRVIGPVRLSAAAAPVLSCVAAGSIAVVSVNFFDQMVAAALALGFYGLRAASHWNIARLRLAWHGRLD
jgi:O-antigen/teichoic acid export membrane protein